MGLSKNKRCTRCKKLLPRSKFRIRQKAKNGTSYPYTNPTCKKCDSEIAGEGYQKKKNDPEFKKKNRDRAKEYNRLHSDKIKEKNKIKRASPLYREYVRQYWRSRPEQRAKHKIRARGHHVKTRDALTDKYVIAKIIQRTSLKKEDLSPEIIEAWKLKIQLSRELEKIKATTKNL